MKYIYHINANIEHSNIHKCINEHKFLKKNANLCFRLVEELISKYGFQQQPTNQTNNADRADRQPTGQNCGIHTFFSELLSNQQLTVQEAVDFAEELFIAGVESVSQKRKHRMLCSVYGQRVSFELLFSQF